MDFSQTFLFYGNYDTSQLKKIIKDNELNWNELPGRAKICFEMKNTQTIPIVYDRDFFSSNFKPVYHKNYELFKEELQKISFLIKEKTEGRGYLLRAILTKLFAGKDIPEHIDEVNETFRYSRRIHIPIHTNSDCIFKVGDESINMRDGEIWEMNNDKKIHSVINNGVEDRIHLIIDWCEKTPDEVEGYEKLQ